MEGLEQQGIAMIIVLAALLLPAAISDLRTRRIPNVLSLAGLLAGIALHASYTGFPGVLESLGGMGLALAIGFLLFAIGWLGAGDAKLIAAIGAVVGLSQIFQFLVWIVFSGGLVAVVALLVRGVLPRLLARWWATLAISLATRRWQPMPAASTDAVEIPYAVSIALGVAFAVLAGRLWTAG